MWGEGSQEPVSPSLSSPNLNVLSSTLLPELPLLSLMASKRGEFTRFQGGHKSRTDSKPVPPCPVPLTVAEDCQLAS